MGRRNRVLRMSGIPDDGLFDEVAVDVHQMLEFFDVFSFPVACGDFHSHVLFGIGHDDAFHAALACLRGFRGGLPFPKQGGEAFGVDEFVRGRIVDVQVVIAVKRGVDEVGFRASPIGLLVQLVEVKFLVPFVAAMVVVHAQGLVFEVPVELGHREVGGQQQEQACPESCLFFHGYFVLV